MTADESEPRRPAAAESELIAAILRKDRKAASEFVSLYSDHVYSYVRWRLAPDASAIEDTVQEVFLEAWKGLARYRGESGLRAWLLGIARHKVQDHYRQALRNFELPEETAGEVATGEDIERATAEQQRYARVHQILRQLPDTYRFVLLWRYWDMRAAAEIAAELGRTEKAVERLLARARTQFRVKYGAD